jgi:hypothetical protein
MASVAAVAEPQPIRPPRSKRPLAVGLLMSGSFVHKIIIAGCRCFACPLPSGPAKRMQMRIARQPDAPTRRRHRYAIVGLLMAAILVLATFALITQLRKSTEGSAAPNTTLSEPRTTTTAGSTIGTHEEIVTRIHQIFRVRDQAIRTRNPLLLDSIYTVDCPCLTGDRQLIESLRQEQRLWRGVKVSLVVRKVEKINNRLWTVSAEVTTSSFEITTESGAIVQRLPKGREFSRFALARPMGQKDWLLGQASVIKEPD